MVTSSQLYPVLWEPVCRLEMIGLTSDGCCRLETLGFRVIGLIVMVFWLTVGRRFSMQKLSTRCLLQTSGHCSLFRTHHILIKRVCNSWESRKRQLRVSNNYISPFNAMQYNLLCLTTGTTRLHCHEGSQLGLTCPPSVRAVLLR